ncbi:MAG: hypothetical protein U5L96_10220 [Owenweeksia sp.]|nr:hypothetical protein [Owenweeksia sp.]
MHGLARNPSNLTATKSTTSDTTDTVSTADSLVLTGERHLKNIRQLTDGGDNAEAYFSFNDKMAVFQSNNTEWGVQCDQIFYFDIEHDRLMKKQPKMLSTGDGRTTCSYFMPGILLFYTAVHIWAVKPAHPNPAVKKAMCGQSTRVMTFL